eukprot:7388758-Prymnesium_polylepis.3
MASRVGCGACGGLHPRALSCCGRSHSGSTCCACSGSSGGRGDSSSGRGVSEPMLCPARSLCAPDGDLVVLVTISELVRTAVIDIEPLAHLWKVSRGKWALSEGTIRGKLLPMITTWAALTFQEPLAVQEGPVHQEVVDIFL